jgi:hypothetical protein
MIETKNSCRSGKIRLPKAAFIGSFRRWPCPSSVNCHIENVADFPIGECEKSQSDAAPFSPADWEIGDTAGLETCATGAAPGCSGPKAKWNMQLTKNSGSPMMAGPTH